MYKAVLPIWGARLPLQPRRTTQAPGACSVQNPGPASTCHKPFPQEARHACHSRAYLPPSQPVERRLLTWMALQC